MKQEMEVPPCQTDDDQRPGKPPAIHHDSRYLPRRGDLAEVGVDVCVRLCWDAAKRTLLIAVITDVTVPAQRVQSSLENDV